MRYITVCYRWLYRRGVLEFCIKPCLNFSFYLCLRLTNPSYAFMRRRNYRKRNVKEYNLERIEGWNWTRRSKYIWSYRCADKWYFLWTPKLVSFKTINKDNSYFFLKTLGYLLTWVPYHLKPQIRYNRLSWIVFSETDARPTMSLIRSCITR